MGDRTLNQQGLAPPSKVLLARCGEQAPKERQCTQTLLQGRSRMCHAASANKTWHPDNVDIFES
eukprot:14858787-Alexandrium_andersonii.AAC.1